MEFELELKAAAKEYGIALDEQQIASFQLYYELLLTWNKRINLTAITEPHEVAVKHIIDSLSVWDGKIFKPESKIVDIGTGAGFPGIPLKIFQPSLQIVLLDSLQKRLNFLQQVIDTLKLTGISCVHMRAEDGAKLHSPYREDFDVAVSRAVARLPILAEYALPFVRTGGFFVAMKGSAYKKEMAEAKGAVKLLGGGNMCARDVELPGLSDKRAVIYIKKINNTAARYPRRAGMAEKEPLGL